jgi:hypothetical protein
LIAFSLIAREVTQRVRVWIDETGGDDEAGGVDDPHRRHVRFASVADKDDPIAHYADICGAWFFARTVYKLALENQQVELLAKSRLRIAKLPVSILVKGGNLGEREQCARDYQDN